MSTATAPEIARGASLLRTELLRIAQRFKDAEDQAIRAGTAGDVGAREAAEAQREDANGAYHAACLALADLQLMLLRNAIDYRADALSLYLAQGLRSQFEPIAQAVARLEGRR